MGDAAGMKSGFLIATLLLATTPGFQFSRIIVRFQRDAAGRIIGLDFSNPVLRNIRFTRASEPANGR